MTIAWTHKPGSPVPFKSALYSVGVNFHGLYQALRFERNQSRPLGEPFVTPEEAKAFCEAYEAGKVPA